MRSPASVLCPCESLPWRTMIPVGLTVALGMWEEGMMGTEGTKLCPAALQLGTLGRLCLRSCSS